MVKKESSVYLFIGQESLAKTSRLKTIKETLLPPEVEKFNFDLLYAKDLSLLQLQEKLLALPLKTKKRIIAIKNAQDLKPEVQNFILEYVRKPYPQIILVLDVETASWQRKPYGHKDHKNEFISEFSRSAEVEYFGEEARLDAFALSRQIERRSTDSALKILSQLLDNGERPERILGGLRYSWLKNASRSAELKRRVKLLLRCDLDIKTGRLNPEFALEKLVVSLCSF